MTKSILAGLLVFGGLLLGCGERRGGSSHAHSHEPPHGGTAVELGAHEYQLEFVFDEAAARLKAYVFDGHMQNFIRLPVSSFEVIAALPGREQTLVFKPVANAATGETAGDTALFEAEADWLKASPHFDGVLKELTIRGKTYRDVRFHFSGGKPGQAAKP